MPDLQQQDILLLCWSQKIGFCRGEVNSVSGPGVTMRYRLAATRGCRCKWGFFGVVFHAEVDPSTKSVSQIAGFEGK